MPITDSAIRKLKPKAKSYKVADAKGLFLLVTPNGGRWWRFRFRVERKEKLLSLGTYPDVTLKAARRRRDEARAQLANGIDPSVARKAAKSSAVEDGESFEFVAREWLAKVSPTWAPRHAEKITGRLERDVFPWLGARPIKAVTSPELLAVLRRIEARGAIETAHRALQNCGQVFRYALATGRAERDPSGDLRGALAPVKERHHASITDPKAIGGLLRAIEGYQGSPFTKAALQLAPLVFVRPGELRYAEWSEIDLDKGEWRIPGHKMKMDSPHVVPLSSQALAILQELQPHTGGGQYLFPSVRTRSRPMSENTVNAALRRLGYSGTEMTGHGFRSMASTLLNEQGWHRDAIERQLAHAERDAIRAAYNHADHLPERRKMMIEWANYLDGLKTGANVVPIKQPATEA